MSKVRLLQIMVAICVLVALAVLAVRKQSIQFNSDSWKLNSNLRPRMLHDLISSNRLNGISRSDVADLLGDPNGQDTKMDDRYVYWVGYSGIDDQWLEIKFRGDAVESVRIYPD